MQVIWCYVLFLSGVLVLCSVPVFLAFVPSQALSDVGYGALALCVLCLCCSSFTASSMQLVVSACSWICCLPWSMSVLRFAKTFKQASLLAVY